MKLVDTHTHLYLEEFRQDLDHLIADAKSRGLAAVYLPAIDSDTHASVMQLEDRYPGFCYAMMGLHPCSVNTVTVAQSRWLFEISCSRPPLSPWASTASFITS